VNNLTNSASIDDELVGVAEAGDSINRAACVILSPARMSGKPALMMLAGYPSLPPLDFLIASAAGLPERGTNAAHGAGDYRAKNARNPATLVAER
jgi:hypothetical protein